MLTLPLEQLEAFNTLIKDIENKTTPVLATGVVDSQKCHLVFCLLYKLNKSSVIITHSELNAKQIYDDIEYFMKDKVKYYPSKDAVFYNADVRSVEITKRRLQVVESLLKGEQCVVVLSAEALLDKLTPKHIFKSFILELSVGEQIPIESLIEKLQLIGYERSDIVYSQGQYAVRGCIVDIFPILSNNAIRIEFFDDEIDSIRFLDIDSQRSIEKINDKTEIFPMRELVFNDEKIKEVKYTIEKEYKKAYENYVQKGLHEEANNLKNTVFETLEKLEYHKNFAGIESYVNYFYKNSSTILDYICPETILFFDEPQKISEHIKNVDKELNENIKNKMLKGLLLKNQSNFVFSYSHILTLTQSYCTILFTMLTHSIKDFIIKRIINFDVKTVGVFKNQAELLFDDLKYWKDNNYTIAVLAGGQSRGERLVSEINEKGIPCKYCDNILSEQNEQIPKGVVFVSSGNLNKGFEYRQIKFVVVTLKEFYGNKKKRKPSKKTHGAKIQSFVDLKIGDYIVHDNHGIGIYKGIEQIVRDGVSRDYLKLLYADGGVLYIHTSQMDMIQKYIGSDSAKLKLNKLSSGDFTKAKLKAKAAAKVLASELLSLYAKRQSVKGFSYSKDTVWQQEFEDSFPYEETEDQLTAIADVKDDMESDKVMDRLICGDVGYGKTEIAIRAAFKAVQDNKQVAYLVPTTILAQQHYSTFTQRMKDFPISIEMLSRFKTPKQQKESIEKIKNGIADIAIGTHRLLSKDIKFKNLGLVIIDEEQRFGVAHKEKLKQFKKDVDVLTLTATPIPRTLHMSMIRIRDMSILQEPPGERQPIQTYVMEYDLELVKEAINRELSRGGQVYYLHNKVRNIEEIARKIQLLVPDAAVSFAHGQMSEHELEYVMMDFIEGEIDVLVCTTIIETGLDIPNVNTIIIQDADHMGLSQLYQLRGRVGRSNRLAYAYLMYRKDKVLVENAEKRLQTIREFTEFGSGFKIAMRDLEIRGAGSILGGEQHGHLDVVGYDMYCRLLAEAVSELKDEKAPETFETTIDININAYIPAFYIESEEQKLEIYKKIASISNMHDYYDVWEEIEDRFGNIPVSVQNLLEIALLKAYAHKAEIVSVVQKQGTIVMTFKENANVDILKIFEITNNNKEKLLFSTKGTPTLVYGKVLDIKNALKEIRGYLTELECFN